MIDTSPTSQVIRQLLISTSIRCAIYRPRPASSPAQKKVVSVEFIRQPPKIRHYSLNVGNAIMTATVETSAITIRTLRVR
jgi:hypothetical protein